MTYTFRPAVREQTSLLIGLAGPSSSGKTYSALRLATGMANGGPITVIDTEGRRALHYADAFKFQHGELAAPFRPERYQEALEAAKKLGSQVIIVDSMSHEHEGPGGILEWHEEELSRMAGNDWAKRERVKFTAWIKPKRSHNLFVNSVLQLGAHLIFCFRAKPKLAMMKNDKGKMEPTDAGWQPICSDRFEYEMTALLMLPPNGQGIPDLSAPATKLQEQHKAFVKGGEQISEDMGKRFAEWAAGGVARQSTQTATTNGANGQQDVVETAKEMAAQGKEAFTAWWQGAGKPHRKALKPHLAMLQQIAEDADAGGEEDEQDEDPFGLSSEAAESQPAEISNGGGEAMSSTGNGSEQVGEPPTVADDLIAKFGRMRKLETLQTAWAEANDEINKLSDDEYNRVNLAYEQRQQELRAG